MTLRQDILKIWALIAMTADHIAEIFPIPHAELVRTLIGRQAFPIFAFLIAYHLAKAEIFKKYMGRLAVFALITLAVLTPFEARFQEYDSLNIFFSLLLGVMALFVMNMPQDAKTPPVIRQIIQAFLVVCLATASLLCDYAIMGFLLMITLFMHQKTKSKTYFILSLLCAAGLNLHDGAQIAITVLTMAVLLTVPLTSAPRGKRRLPWAYFYGYYPAHLCVLYAIRWWWET